MAGYGGMKKSVKEYGEEVPVYIWKKMGICSVCHNSLCIYCD